MIRDVLLAIYASVWAIAAILTVWRTQTLPNELLAALGVGIGTILAAFRADDYASRRSTARNPDPEPDELEGRP